MKPHVPTPHPLLCKVCHQIHEHVYLRPLSEELKFIKAPQSVVDEYARMQEDFSRHNCMYTLGMDNGHIVGELFRDGKRVHMTYLQQRSTGAVRYLHGLLMDDLAEEAKKERERKNSERCTTQKSN